MLNKYRLRVLFQILFLIVAVIMVFTISSFIAHRYCPYAVVCFGIRGLNQEAAFVFISAIIAGLIILISTLFVGRRFCGYICPLGTVVEYLNYLNPFRKKNRRKRVPLPLEKKLRIGKYLVLIASAVMAFMLVGYIYYVVCPVMLSTGSMSLSIAGIIVVAIIVIGSIFIRRFWCRYLCGYAALMNCYQFIGERLGIKRFRIYRNLEICTDCRCCEYDCQMNIEITYIEDFNCIFCLNCIKTCPKDMCLNLTDKGHS